MLPRDDDAPELSILLLNWNTKELLQRSLRAAIESAAGLSAEHLVVDNGSDDGSAESVAAWPEVTLIRLDRNHGPARGWNVGLERARGRFVALVNTDAFLTRPSLHRLVEFLRSHSDYSVVVPKLLNEDGTTQRGVLRFPTMSALLWHDSLLARLWPDNPWRRRYLMQDFDHESSRDVDQPPQAVMLLRREVFERVGLHDERLRIYFNDVDLCARMKSSGLRIRYLAEAEVVHLGGATARKRRDRAAMLFRDRIRYARKHFGRKGDLLARFGLVSTGAWEMVRVLLRARAPFRTRLREARKIARTMRAVHRSA